MAIEFDCPECQATIKVPDHAAGKKGSCPTCRKKLVVPTPGNAAPAHTPAPKGDDRKTAHGGESGTEAPRKKVVKKKIIRKVVKKKVVRSSPDAAAPSADVSAAPAFVDDAAPSLDMMTQPSSGDADDSKPEKVVRKRRKRSKINLGAILPLLFGSILLAVLAWWYLDQKETSRLSSTVEGEIVNFPDVRPEFIDPATIDVPEDTRRKVLDRLQDRKVRINTSARTMTVVISGEERGLQIKVVKGTGGRWARFKIEDRELIDYIKLHRPDWDKERNRLRKKAATDFVQAVDEADSSGSELNPSATLRYRDEMALNTTTGGLGFALEAIAQKTASRAVYEDTAGNIYFLVPTGTKEFTVRGRDLGEGLQKFEPILTVKLTSEVEGEAKPKEGGDSPEDDDIPGLGEQLGGQDLPGMSEQLDDDEGDEMKMEMKK